jgi:hypothetical protein
LCATHMAIEEDKAICAAIGAELKATHFALFVQSMLTLTRKDIEAAIIKCGGKLSWVAQIEALLGHQFQDVEPNAPLSAHLVGRHSSSIGTPSCEVVLIDQDNVRAAAGWPDARSFRQSVLLWAKDYCGANTAVILEVDELKHKKSRPTAQRAQMLDERVAATFLGPRWRADDGLVRDVEWWMPRSSAVLVVSSDKLVRRRCADVKQRLSDPSCQLRYETGEAFAMQLPTAVGEHRLGSTCVPATTAPLADFVAWIEREQPGPQRTAADFSRGGASAVRGGGTKRRR